MTPVGLVIAGGVLWLLKHIIGSLISQQVKGSVPDYTANKARAAARLLPPNLAEEYEEEWLAELEGPLKDKPLSALKYALGLRLAAQRIAVKTKHSGLRLSSISRSKSAERIRLIAGLVKSLVVLLRLIWLGVFVAIAGLWVLTHNDTLVLLALGTVGAIFGLLFLVGLSAMLEFSRKREHEADR